MHALKERIKKIEQRHFFSNYTQQTTDHHIVHSLNGTNDNNNNNNNEKNIPYECTL